MTRLRIVSELIRAEVEFFLANFLSCRAWLEIERIGTDQLNRVGSEAGWEVT